MLERARISSGSFSIGMISIDSALVRAEGGLLAPTVVIPITVELDQRPESERIALLRLEAALWVANPGGSVQLGPPVVVFGDGSNGGLWATTDTHKFETRRDLRFTLTAGMLRVLEETLHSMQQADLTLTLKIRPGVGRVLGTSEVATALGPAGQTHLLGTAYEIHPIAWPTVDHLDVRISREQWAEIAKSIGLEEARVVLVRLPKQVDGFDPQLVSLFDQAVSKYETRDYREAIGICRDVRNLAEKALRATKTDPVSAIIAAERGLNSSSPPIRFLGDAWKLFVEFTNAARHDQSIDSYTAADARAMLLFTALLLDYLAGVLQRRL